MTENQPQLTRLAVVQTQPVFGDVATNVRAAVELMQTASADLYVLPELFNAGYNFLKEDEVERVAEAADGQTFNAIFEFCRKNSCYIVYGFAERDVHFYNSAALVGPGGLIGVYRKVHLFDRENLFFKPGNLGFPVFELPFGRVGMMVCFDWIFPESARTLALKGAQLVAHPSNLVLPYCPDAMVTRCLENKVFSATADRVGNERRGGFDLRFIGSSEIVSPRGEILTRLGRDEAGISVVAVDLSLADRKRINEHNDLIADRRPDQYTR